MVLATIEAFLSKKIGIDPQTIGSRKIARVVETRQAACGLANLDAYVQLLQTSPQEMEELVEQIVVPETWFFRDRKPFELLKQVALSPERPNANLPLRILSIPCSTGEEPYSIAISLIEAGLLPHQFTIEAIDISKRAIAKAQRAVYGKNSFRGEEVVDRSRYFQATDDGYELSPVIRNTVKFRQGNLLNAFTALSPNYDVVFCRNLLIYLDQTVCTQVMTLLARLLVPGGLLFVGASETAKVPTSQFISIRQPYTFAYQKTTTQEKTGNGVDVSLSGSQSQSLRSSLPKPSSNDVLSGVAASTAASATVGVTGHDRPQVPQKLGGETTMRSVTIKSSAPRPSVPDLSTVRTLADQGDLERAINLCQSYLQHHAMSDEAHTLLGELYQAAQLDAQADQCFQKALYLNPQNQDALMHLLLLKQHQGDMTTVLVLQQRMQRLQLSSKQVAP